MKDDACQSARRVGVTEGGTLSEGCTGISWDESPLGVDFEKPSQDVHEGVCWGAAVVTSETGDQRAELRQACWRLGLAGLGLVTNWKSLCRKMTVAGAQGGKPEPNMSTHSLDSIVRTVGCVGNKQGAMEGSGQTSDHTQDVSWLQSGIWGSG